MIKKMISTLCAMIFCLGLLPIAAYAVEGGGPTEGTVMSEPATLAAAPSGQELYVGGVQISSTGYWTTDSDGTVASAGNTQPGDNYIHYNANDNILTLHNATIKKGLAYDQNTPAGITIHGSAIGVLNQSGDAELTVQLEGSNTIDEVSTGIYVHSSGGGAALSITGNGTLVIDSIFCPIQVISFNGNAALSIENVKVTATSSYDNGVTVQRGSSETSSASLTVNGGSLTATTQSSGSSGIRLRGTGETGGSSPTVTVSNDAIVRANGSAGGITSDSSTGVQYGTGGNTIGGIVWNGSKGTMYGNVTLNESLTINQGETLIIPQGSTLNTNGNLTNNGTIVNTGGTLTGEPGGIIVTAPAITTESLPDGTAGQSYTATLEATGNNITWSASGLPAGLTLDADTGAITGTPTTDGQFQVTVTATNSVGNIDRTYTLNIKPATVSVTGLKLDKDSLTLQENGRDILTATVEPADATNKAVTWASNDNNIATVSEGGTVTAINAGTATITATAADGSGISASCNLTVTHGNMIQTPKKDATCTVDGTEEYWTCEICGKHFSDEEGKMEIELSDTVISKLGHSYGESVWIWSEDGKSCTVTFTCVNDASHVETLAATITSKVKTPATCTEKGITEYSASVSFNGNTYTDIKEVADIPATSHHYIEGKCSVCGAIETTATVPNTDNSQEGMDNVDANNKALPEISDSTLPLAVVALILGIGAITGIVIALRNMRQ